jgi:aspartate racemase
MGWESTVIYYQKINRMINSVKGGQHTAKLHVSSVDFGEAYPMIKDRRHSDLALLISSDLHLQSQSGCELSLICCNTAHQALPYLEDEVKRGVVPIMKTVAQEAQRCGYGRVALLGTSSTLDSHLYDNAFDEVHIACIKPNTEESARMDEVIFTELMFGKITAESMRFAQQLIEKMRSAGAEAVVLGCTELPMLITQEDCCLPILDSVELHCRKAVSIALEVV